MSIGSIEKSLASTARGPGRPRDAAKDVAIMDAAQRLFMERGFDGSSMDAIAEAAGVAKATVYARFPDKETLLKASIAAKCQSFLDPETLDWRFGRTLRDGLLDIARRFLSLVTDPEAIGMHRLMTHEGQRSDRLPSLFFQSAIRPTVLRLAQFLEDESKFNQSGLPVDSVAAAWRFLGMVKGEDHMRAIFGMTPRPREEIDAHIEACVDDFIRANFPNA